MPGLLLSAMRCRGGSLHPAAGAGASPSRVDAGEAFRIGFPAAYHGI